MRYLDERVWVIIRELRPLIERSNTDIVKWQTKKKLFMRPEEADLDPMPWESFDSSTDRWYGKDTYYWFRAQFTVPQSMDQKCIFLKIHIYSKNSVNAAKVTDHHALLITENAAIGLFTGALLALQLPP